MIRANEVSANGLASDKGLTGREIIPQTTEQRPLTKLLRGGNPAFLFRSLWLLRSGHGLQNSGFGPL